MLTSITTSKEMYDHYWSWYGSTGLQVTTSVKSKSFKMCDKSCTTLICKVFCYILLFKLKKDFETWEVMWNAVNFPLENLQSPYSTCFDPSLVINQFWGGACVNL